MREIPIAGSTSMDDTLRRPSMNPEGLDATVTPVEAKNESIPGIPANHHMLEFDFNNNPLILKCRLYVVKALIYRGWDHLGKADPFIKIALNGEVIIDDVQGKIQNTLEPVFGR